MATYDDEFSIKCQPRALRFDQQTVDPARLAREQLAQIHQRQRDATDALLVQLAQTRFQLDRLRADLPADTADVDPRPLGEALDIISANLQDVLAEHGVTVEDLTARPWQAQMRAEVDVRGHEIREDLSEPRVAYMELPVVYRGKRLIAKGAASVEAPLRDPK